MSQGPRYRVPMRRRREGRTDYRRRLGLMRSGLPRAVVRKTLNNTIVQIIEFKDGGDRVIASSVSKELVKHDWRAPTGNVPAAYLTGFLAGKKALAKGVRGAVLDMGLHEPRRGTRVFAALKGMVDAGLEIPHGVEVLPPEARIRGEHIKPEVTENFGRVKAKLEAL